MTKKIINPAIESHLINNEPFEYAHLVKFERPFHPHEGSFRSNANRFAHLTDGARDIEFEGSTYKAQQLLSVGSYSETTQAKASNMTITMPGEYLGTTVTITGTLAGNNNTRTEDLTTTLTATSDFVDGYIIDFAERGFKIGDKISLKKENGTLFSIDKESQTVSEKIFIISGLTNSNKTLNLTQTGIDSDDSSFTQANLNSSFIVTLLNEEILSATMDKGTDALITTAVTNSDTLVLSNSNARIKIGQSVDGPGIETDTYVTSIRGTSLKVNKNQIYLGASTKITLTNPTFINRQVFIYKIFIDPDTGSVIGAPILVFKGLVASTDISEGTSSSKIKWGLTSHWGDFLQVNGRLSSDPMHRALDSNGAPQKKLAIKPSYASDLGFLHSEVSLNALAIYETQETKYRQKTKRRGGPAGFFGGTKSYIEEYQEDIQHEIDLSMYLQGKYIPVVYGVQRVPGIPVFADTLSSDAKTIYLAYAIAEGEIQGIYNMYLDGNSVLCVDETDSEVRSSAATDNSQALLCVGRIDKGDTLGGTNIGEGEPLSYDEWVYEQSLVEAYYDGGDDKAEQIIADYDEYIEILESDIPSSIGADTAEGLGHEESASISHPYNMDFTFYSGRPQQRASDILVTRANDSDNFKRQSDYYSGTEQYWGPNHRLLDTAYCVLKVDIDADSTTVPEVEYVIKGKALECLNYDGTFVPDPVFQAETEAAYGGEADSALNFKEGDTVSVETSFNGRNWETETGFRILHKTIQTTTRNSTHSRFILDRQPNLGLNGISSIGITNSGTGYTSAPTISFSGGGGSGATAVATIMFGALRSITITNPGTGYTSAPTVVFSAGNAAAISSTTNYGIPQRKYIRLKSSANKYWHMLSYNANIIDTPISLSNSNLLPLATSNAIITDSSGVLKITLANSTQFNKLYPNATNTNASVAYIQLNGILKNNFASSKDIPFRVSKNGNVLTVLNATFLSNQTSESGGSLTATTVQPARAFEINSTHEFRKLANGNAANIANTELVGSLLEMTDTGETREIISVDSTNNIVTLEGSFSYAPTITATTNDNTKYKIHSRGKDLRSSINPAIQTLDMLINDRYGKGLDLDTDIEVASIRTAALLCDTRSDVTVPLSSATNLVKGDVYKLSYTDAANVVHHKASGELLETVSSATAATFTKVSGKFFKLFGKHIKYSPGDIIKTFGSNNTIVRYYQYTATASAYRTTQPTHTSGSGSGATANWTYLSASSINLSKVTGSGASTIPLSLSTDGIQYSLFDSDFVKYWRYIGWNESKQHEVTRHQTNFYFDTSKPIFENINALLSHYNGILSYSNAKYSLSVETQSAAPVASISNGIQSNPEYIDESDIIGTINLKDDSNRKGKNTIKASINDPQNHFSSRSVSFFNSDFLKADRNVVKTGSYPVSGITSYYNARIGIEKELIQSRYSKEITFKIGPRGLLLKPGEVIAITYKPFGFESKLFRIENLNYDSTCNTSIKATEYDDTIYAITQQNATGAERATAGMVSSATLPTAPTSLATATSKPGIITLNWTNATNYKEGSDSTEVWRASTQGSSGLIPAHATLLTIVDNASTYSDPLGIAGSFYYWIRHRRAVANTVGTGIKINPGSFNAAITAGVSGVAKVLSPQLDVDISSALVKFNSSNALTPGGASQDLKFTATLRNITANNVTFTLVDNDTTSTSSDVTFTNNNSSVVDTTAPYEATIDASSFSHSTLNKFVKITTTDSGSNETFTELVPISVTKDGSSGGVGIDAVAIKLTPNTHVISYSATGTESTNVNFTVANQGVSGFTGTPQYEFLVDGDSKQNGTTATFSLAQADKPASNTTKTVLVKLRDGSTSDSPKATDSVTIFGVKDGSDSVSVFLTNSAHVVSANSSGVVSSFTGAGGTFKVLVGSTDRTTACTYSEVSGQETTGLTSVINSSTGVYSVSALSVDLGQNTFRATIPANISPTGVQMTIDQTFTISKSKQGGIGTAGTNAKVVTLTANDYSVQYATSGGGSPSPSSASLTATASNFLSPRYQFIIDGTAGSYGTGNTATFTAPSNISSFSASKTMQVNVVEATDTSTVIAFDTISIFGVKSGADGSPGSDAHTVYTTNNAHAFPATNSGTVADSDEGAGATEIRVFRGSTQLTYSNGGGSSGTNTYDVSQSASGITMAESVVSNQRKFTPTAVSANTGTVIFTITAGGTSFPLLYTFTKSKAGAAGSNAQNQRQPSIFRKNSSSINNTSGNFSNPLTGNTDWSFDVPAITANGDEVYVSTRILTSDGADPQENTWSTPALYAKRVDGTTVTNQGIRQANLYKKNDSSLTSNTAGNFSNPLTGNTDWSFDVPPLTANNDKVYVATRTFTSDGATPQATSWSSPVIYAQRTDGDDGDDGDDGNNVALVHIYKQQAFALALPTISSTSNYNFDATGLTNIPAGWSTTLPTFQKYFAIYESEAIVIGTGTTNTVNWPTPALYNPFFDLNPAVYKRGTSSPSISNGAANPPSGWSLTIPSGTNPVWQSVGTFNYATTGSTYTWSTPEKITGDTGDTGINSATIILYKATTADSRPDHPDSILTWNFANKAFTVGNTHATLDGWSVNNIPASDNTYLWTCSATASASTATDTIAVGDWSAETKIGSPKAVRLAAGILYHTATTTSVTAAPSTSGVSYNFDTGVFSGSNFNGWSNNIPLPPYSSVDYKVTESTFGGTQTITLGTSRYTSELIKRPPGDFDFEYDDSNNKFQLKFGTDLLSELAVPNDIKNSQISLPTFTSGSAVPTNGSAPDGSTYRRTTTPNELYTSDGSTWTLVTINTDTIFTLPADVLKGTISVSGTTVTVPKSDGSSYTFTTQDTQPTATSGNNTLPSVGSLIPGSTYTKANGGIFIAVDEDNWQDISLSGTDTTFSAGVGLTLSGTEFSHTDTSSQGSINNSGRTYIQDITLDTFGHVTGLVSATETVTNTTYSVQDGELSQNNFTNADHTKLNGITAGATANAGTVTSVATGNGLTGGAISSTGTIAMSGGFTGTFTASADLVAFSDKKLKDNILTLDGSKVFDMRGVSFTRNDQDDKLSSGVIAQELEKIAPELVHESEDGTKGVAYGNTIGYLIEAVKLLKEEIEELKSGTTK